MLEGAPSYSRAKDRAPAKILLVEDDLPMQEGIRDVLELGGYRVVTATNGSEGLAALARETPDLVISDIMMPRMDGLEFCRRVRQEPRWASLPFVFLTAKGQKTDVRAGMSLGADDYLGKPFEMQELLDVVETRLQRTATIKQEMAAQAARLREMILHTVSHELRTPLTFVKGYTELMEESGGDLTSEEFMRFLSSIKLGSDRLGQLVDDLILLISLETDDARLLFEYEKQRVDLSSVVLEAVAALKPKAAARNVMLLTQLERPSCQVVGHLGYLLDATKRILDNGIKFSKPQGGRIVIRTEERAHQAYVRFADDGIGIPADQLGQIFQSFYQVGREQREQQGAGIGLPIASKIAELHGGRLEVQSSVGVGSVFSLALPVASQTYVSKAGSAVGWARPYS
ncbi:MAG: hybrid sensor histidine kinase/response regulator [Chloroflexi bacterium]|nr:hybrid sensor histidine kinase/response regulator [Chloroflexota bacterium]